MSVKRDPGGLDHRSHYDRGLLELALRAEEDARILRGLLETAVDVQWSRPKKGQPGPRGRGGPPSDPTGETAVDPRRLRVRRALKDAGPALKDAANLLADTRSALDRALEAMDPDPSRRTA